MKTAFFSLILIVISTGTIMAGGNMTNKLPAMIIVAVCMLLFISMMNSRSKARRS